MLVIIFPLLVHQLELTTVQPDNVLAQPDNLGVLLKANVLLFHHVVHQMTDAVIVIHSFPEQPGVILPMLVTMSQLDAHTAITVKLFNAYVQLVKPGAQIAIPVSLFHHVVLPTTIAVTV